MNEQRTVPESVLADAYAELAAAKREIERLRAALEGLLDAVEAHKKWDSAYNYELLLQQHKLAREAISTVATVPVSEARKRLRERF